MILVILTLIGISASRTSNTDVIAARNLIPHKQDFYVAEAGQI
jgi:Tfp pilus assembly protein PilX